MKTLRKKIAGTATLRGSASSAGPPSPGGSNIVADNTRTPPPEPIPTLATEIIDATQCLKLIHAKLIRNSAVTATSMESEHSLSEAFGSYSSRLHLRDESDEVLGQCMGDLQQLIVYVQNLRGAMDGAIKGKVNIPMNEFVQDDLKRAKMTKKKFDKANQNLDNASHKLAQIQKGKINLVKQVEAESERDAMKKIFDEETQETIKVLKEVNDRNQFETLEQLCDYFEEYKKFFKAGHQRMLQLEPKLKEYRTAVEARKEAFRNEGKQVADRVRLSSTTLEFKDINVSLWEKETDKRKIALMQLVEDERLYLALINSLMVNYRDVLMYDDKFSQKVERGDITIMFSGLSELFGTHKSLYNELRAQVAAYPQCDVGEVFLDKAQSLQFYNQFVINNSTKQDAVDRVEKNSSTVKGFLKVSEDKDEANLRLLLSVPCGRIKKYEKYIQLMLEQSSQSDPSYRSLEEALSSLQMLQSSVEQGLEISERLVKVLGVRNSLVGYDQLDTLVDRHREYVTEGDLLIANSAVQKKAEEHHFFVFNNLVIYTKKEASLQAMIGISSTRYKYVGSVPIQEGCSLREVIDNDVMHIRNAFELAWSGNSLLLMSESPEAKIAWKNTFSSVLNALATDRVFGIPLKDLMAGRENGRDIPSIVENTIQWLRDNNIKKVEGIFRVSGMMTEVQEFKARADQGLAQIYPATADPHCVAGVLKLWIRELPEPLLSYALYDRLIASKHIPDEQTRIRETAALIKQLPDFNKFTLQYLMEFLHEVSLDCETNKMNAHNLSIVFGPNLLYRETADPFDCSQFQEVYDVTRFLVVHYESLFKEPAADREAYRSSHTPNPITTGGSGGGSGGGGSRLLKSNGPTTPRSGAVPTPSIPPSALPGPGGASRSARPRPSPPGNPVPARPTGNLPPRPAQPSIPSQPQHQEQPVPQPSSGGSTLLSSGGTPPLSPSSTSPPGPAGGIGGMMRPDLMKQLQQATAKRGAGPPPSTGQQQQPPPQQLPPPSFGPPPTLPTPPPSTGGGGGGGDAPSSVTGLRKMPPRPPPNRVSPRAPGNGGEESGPSAPAPSSPPEALPALPLCASCSLPISGKGINALDQKWHTECFVCTHCRQPFTGSYVPHEGKPYCAPHFTQLFGKRCGGCNELITGAFLQAIGRDWHPEHFVCFHCQGSLTDGFFETGEGRPVCSACSPSFFQGDEGELQN